MNIFQSRKLTDAEFVEKIRKQLRNRKRYAWVLLLLSGLLIAQFIYILNFAIHWFASWSEDPLLSQAFQQYQSKVLVISAAFGCIATILWIAAVSCFWGFLKRFSSNRQNKLLVAFYDQLNPANK